jgi:hypothetical protein
LEADTIPVNPFDPKLVLMRKRDGALVRVQLIRVSKTIGTDENPEISVNLSIANFKLIFL